MRATVAAACAVLAVAGALRLTHAAADDVAATALFFATGIAAEDPRLELLAHEANLRLEMATRVAGGVLGAIAVSVIATGGDRVLDAAIAGTWLLARLPPGRYRVIVDDGERRQERSVWLTGNALRTLRFVW